MDRNEGMNALRERMFWLEILVGEEEEAFVMPLTKEPKTVRDKNRPPVAQD